MKAIKQEGINLKVRIVAMGGNPDEDESPAAIKAVGVSPTTGAATPRSKWKKSTAKAVNVNKAVVSMRHHQEQGIGNRRKAMDKNFAHPQVFRTTITCVFIKHTIKVCNSCLEQCPGTSGRGTPDNDVLVSLYFRKKYTRPVEGP